MRNGSMETLAAMGRLKGMFILGCLACLTLISTSAQAAPADAEAGLRETFTKRYKDKDTQKRVDAVKTLAAVQEEKSIALLATALKDPAVEVRRAAAETLQGVTDAGGVAVKPICAVVVNKKEETPVRLAAARALSKTQYKADTIKALIFAISLDESEVLLYAFGGECTTILNKVAGQDFGMDKDTPGQWAKWYKANQAKLVQQDKETLAAYKKAAATPSK